MRRLLLAVACCAAFSAGANAGAPSLKSARISGDEVLLEFDQPMLTWGTRARPPALRLSPAVDCQWTWSDDTRLACAMVEGASLRPATAYRLDIGEGLWSQEGEAFPPTTLALESDRPRLGLEVSWPGRQPRLKVSSSQGHTAASVASVLSLQFDGRPLPYRLQPVPRERWDDPGLTRFAIEPEAWPQGAGELLVTQREGLRSPLGVLPGKRLDLARITLNAPFRLAGVTCADDYRHGEPWTRQASCRPDSDILLGFTQPPSDAALARLAEALPAGLALDDEPRDCGWHCRPADTHQSPLHAVRLSSRAAGRKLSLALPAGLDDTAGMPLQHAEPLTIAFSSFPARTRVSPGVQVALPGQREPVTVEGRNLAAGTVWRELSIGRRTRYLERTLEPTAPAETWGDAGAPGPTWGVLRNGGLSLGGGGAGNGRATVRPAFDLLVHLHERQLLAWATAWGNAAPLAGARVEVLGLDRQGRERVLATGITAADGTAQLELPEGANEPLLMLRARYAGQVSVLPVMPETGLDLATPLDPRDSGEDAYRLGQPRFGVTSRLLYRPGDVVQYRLWLRERKLNRLVPSTPQPRSFALGSAWGDVVSRWEATPDEFGSVSGEIRLPAAATDDEYCIDVLDRDDDQLDGESGACFQVRRFQAQALWAKVDGPQQVLRPGDALPVSIEGGFYSGGPAAGARLQISAWLEPMGFAQAHPAFARFVFASAHDEGSEISLFGRSPSQASLDGKGRATLEARVPARLVDPEEEGFARPLPFARLRVNALVGGDDGQPAIVSPSLQVPVAAHARYVGLRSERTWLALGETPRLEAVVVGYDGVPAPAESVQVRLEHAGPGEDEDVPDVLGRCTLRAGQPSDCALAPPAPGYYRLVAESGDAASTSINLWFGNAPPLADDGPKARFELLQPADGSAPARLRLHQPHARAQALFVLEHERVIRHWSRTVGPAEEFELALDASLAPGATLRVMLRPVLASAQAGLEAPALDAAVELEVPRTPSPGVTLAIDDDSLAPGETLRVTLRNDGSRPRLVVVAVVDDAVHQQMAELHPRLAPGNARFLGSLSDWSVGRWHGLRDWRHVPDWLAEQEPPVVFGDPSPMDSLDSIQVTGSRIKLSEVFPDMPAGEVLPAPPGTPPGRAGPRVRRDFPDAAYWNAGLELAPGESHTLELRLPDNLTRWRVLAWSGDDGDAFDFSEATVTASLPVELRFGLPSRLFEGDRAQGSVTARNATAAPMPVAMRTTIEGATASRVLDSEGVIAPFARREQRLPLVPGRQGVLDLLARADAPGGNDAISSMVPVQSRSAEVTLPQAGWLASPVSLRLPALPPGASEPTLDLQVHAGTAGWRAAWLHELREYPHRCWEQTLSRAVGAAIALQDAADRADWPEAQAVVDEALGSAYSFRDDDSGFHFFTPRWNAGDATALLDAHTLRQLGWLERLGQPVPAELIEPLRERVDRQVERRIKKPTRQDLEALAVAVAAQAGEGRVPNAKAVERLWQSWDSLGWHARSELVQALAGAPGSEARLEEGLARLAEAGRDRGLRRVIESSRDEGWAMGSGLRDQCAVTATLWMLDSTPARLPRRQAMLRGLQDLYSGGTASLDTQASLRCLLALRTIDSALAGGVVPTELEVAHGPSQARLSVDGRQRMVRFEAPANADPLDITPVGDADATLNYIARLRYRQDQAQVEAGGVGLSLQRRYAVLRGGRWVGLGESVPRQGDWVRVTLVVQVPAMRHFVALTDPVPGGFVTRDVGLRGVAGANAQALADPGSSWFGERQTGTNEVRLYAEALPPGRHEVHYFVQAVHPGRYFAPPAVAELMYGRASRANTAGQWLPVHASE